MHNFVTNFSITTPPVLQEKPSNKSPKAALGNTVTALLHDECPFSCYATNCIKTHKIKTSPKI